MKHLITCVGLILSFSMTAQARRMPLAFSKAQISAVMAQLQSNDLLISQITISENGQVKAELVSPSNGSCRAAIFSTYMVNDEVRIKEQLRAVCSAHR
jgi:hypothetical protein